MSNDGCSADCCLTGCVVVPQHKDWVRVVIDPELPPVPCRAGGLELRHDDRCIIETPDGHFLGRITILTTPILREPRCYSGRIVRLATVADQERHEALASLERDIERYLRRRTKDLGLELRPLKVRVPLSGRKAMAYFTAEQRVDFRPLLKELGRRFRRRVEMRPLGVRDGARLSGGLGPCGRGLCCTTFMERFHSVTVRMAKRQNLSLNPTKISGLCGRLMCCLAHEVHLYQEEKKKPKQQAKQEPKQESRQRPDQQARQQAKQRSDDAGNGSDIDNGIDIDVDNDVDNDNGIDNGIDRDIDIDVDNDIDNGIDNHEGQED